MGKKCDSVFEVFDSLEHFVNTINTRSVNEVFRGYEDSQRETSPEWYGTKTYEEAVDFCLRGDKESAKLINECYLPPAARGGIVNKHTYRRNVVGCTPIVPAYNLGLPLNMLQRIKTIQRAKIVNFVVNVGVLGGVSAELVIKASAKIAAIISSLELSGVRVQLYVSNIARENKQKLGFCVKIKNSGAPLNKMQIAFPLINPAFQRRLSFRFRETQTGSIYSSWRGGYGRTCTLNQDEPELKAIFKNNPFVVANISEMIYSCSSASEIATDLLTRAK